MGDPIFLELDDVIEIHADQIERYGGSSGLRDIGLLSSALAMPQAGSGGVYFHSDLFEMAAAYLFHVVKNHPFVDGNKRVGAVAALVFLELNGVDVRTTNASLVELILEVAQGRLGKAEVASFLRHHATDRA